MISVARDISYQDEQGRWWQRLGQARFAPADGSDVPRPFLGTLRGEQVWPWYDEPCTLPEHKGWIDPGYPDHRHFRQNDRPDPVTYVQGDVILGGVADSPEPRFVHLADFEATYIEVQP